MKVITIVIAGVLVAAAALALVFGIPANFLLGAVQGRVESATGYRLRVEGGARIGFWPSPNVSLRDITVLDRAGASSPGQLKAEKVSVALALADLLHARARITQLTISHPTLHVALARERTIPAAAAASTVASGDGTKEVAAPAAKEETKGPATIDRIVVEDGTIGLYSKPDHLEKSIGHINLVASLGSADTQPTVAGRLDWGSQTLQVEAKSNELPQRLEGQTIPVELTVQAPGQWQQPLSLKAELRSRKSSLAINSLSGRFGQSSFDGWATVDFSAHKPLVKADLDFDHLQIAPASKPDKPGPQDASNQPASDGDGTAPPKTPEQPRKDRAATQPQNAPPQSPASGPSNDRDNTPSQNTPNQSSSGRENPAPQNVLNKPWSDRERNLNGLNFLDAELRVTAAELVFESFHFAPITVEVSVGKGVLQAKLEHMGLYGGEANGDFSLDASGSVPAHAMQIRLDGVNALPLLSDVAGVEFLDGTMQANIDVNATGRSQQAAISSLAGNVDVQLSNGAVRGIDVAKLMHNLTRTILQGWQQNAADKTPLSDFGAHFHIANGLAKTDNLQLSGPIVKMTGSGSIDLTAKTLQMKVDPQLVTGRKGSGGSADANGLGVPIVIEGSWSDPRIYPDVAGILNNPDSVYNQLKAAGKGLFGDPGSGSGSKFGTFLQGLGNMLNAPAGNRRGLPGDGQ